MSAVKDAPAFDFYPERWLAGVAAFSDAEQLAYVRLLCHQWLTDPQQGLPDDLLALRRLGGKGVTPALLEKFPVCEDGRRRNARLEKIRTEQRERIAKRRAGASKTNRKRWGERVAHDVASDNAHNVVGESPPPTTHHPPHFETDSQRVRPTLAQARDKAGDVGVTAQEAEDWWLAREASEWMKGTGGGGTTPVGSNWQADMKTFTNADRERRARETGRKDGAKASKPGGWIHTQ